MVIIDYKNIVFIGLSSFEFTMNKNFYFKNNVLQVKLHYSSIKKLFSWLGKFDGIFAKNPDEDDENPYIVSMCVGRKLIGRRQSK